MSQNNTMPPHEDRSENAFLRHVKQFVWEIGRILFHNWPTKLLAVLLAVALWAGLITQDPTLTRERTFTNVPINVTGAETLKRNGLIVVSDLSEVLGDVNMNVAVPQMQYASVQASNYNVRIDLSRIKEAGTQQVRILSTNSSTYGTVSAVAPSTVQLEVDEYVTRYRIPVTMQTAGEAPEGYYAAAPSLDPPTIAVSGPKKLVEKIVQAECVVDQAKLPAREGTVRRAIPFILLDENGEAIRSDLLEVTSGSVLLDSIVVEQQVYTRRDIAMTDMGLVRGEPEEGYEIKSVHLTPETVTVAGRKSVLDALDLLYASSYIDASGLTRSVTQSMPIRQPAQLAHISASEIMVTVEIGPVVTTASFENIPVRVRGLGEGFTAHVDAAATSGTVHITGEELWLDTLNARSFTLVCDATGLTPGTYELPLLCTVRDSEGASFTYEIDPAMVQVTIMDNQK